MKPAFSLSADGTDRTAALTERLLRIRVTDAAGLESDELEISFDDRGGVLVPPRRGVVLAVSLGFAGRPLVFQGRYTVDEMRLEGPEEVLTIRAKAADMKGALKAAKKRSWRGTTVNALVAKIAAEHGLKPAVGAGLGDIAVPHRDQTSESDLHFLTRLGRDMGAVASIKDGRLLFVAKGGGVSASGKVLPGLNLTRGELTRWTLTEADRPDHGEVEAPYYDPKAAQTKTAKASSSGGSGSSSGPTRRLRHVHRSQAEAKRAAEAAKAREQGDAAKIEAELPGRPELAAETPVTLSDLGAQIDGTWTAERVENSMDWSSGGFTTRFEGSRKGTAA